MVTGFGEREVGWGAVENGVVHVGDFAAIEFLLGDDDGGGVAVGGMEDELAFGVGEAGEGAVEGETASGADDFGAGVPGGAEGGGDLGDAAGGVAHLAGEVFIDSGGAEPLVAKNFGGGATVDILGEAEGIDTDVPETATAPIGVEADIVASLEGEVEGGADEGDVTELAILDPVANDFGLGMVAVHERFGEDAVGFLGGGGHGIDFIEGDGERFFAEDMFASAKGFDSPFGVEMVGEADVDSVDEVGVEHGLVGGEGVGDVPLLGVGVGRGLGAAGDGG